MPITQQQLQNAIANARFPIGSRADVHAIVWNGLVMFREFKQPRYMSHTGKSIKKPLPTHRTSIGRYNQQPARTILISALSRAWLFGFDKKATLNHKASPMSPFHHFAQDVLVREGVGKTQEHLEEFWSVRKATWKNK